MNIKIFRNQYTQGGALLREVYELTDANQKQMVYGSCYSMEQIEIQLPDGWSVSEDWGGEPQIYDDNNNIVRIFEDDNGELKYAYGDNQNIFRTVCKI